MARIVIDPGHGGTKVVGRSSPNNSTGPTGLKEKKVALSIGKRCHAALTKRGHTVTLTRSTDKNVGIYARAAIARNMKADAFVSIHFNGWHTPDVQRTETWIHVGHSPKSAKLAKSVQKYVAKATGLRDRGVRIKDFGVLDPERHAPNTAACLAEVSFLTDPDEEARLKTAQYRTRIAKALAYAIAEFVESKALVAKSKVQKKDEPVLEAAKDGMETA